MAEEGDVQAYDPYGGISMRKRSHGQSFMDVFENRFGCRGVYILDEPEAGLSPMFQLEFLKLLRRLENSGEAQVIMATHSPLLMAYPGATLLEVSGEGITPVGLHGTAHFRLLRDFYLNPEGFVSELLSE